MFLTPPIPCAKLRRLEFLLGSYSGSQMVYPPAQDPVRFEVHSNATWETSDRHVQFEFFYRASTQMVGRALCLMGYDAETCEYVMWEFNSYATEPVRYRGMFEGDDLVMVGDPGMTAWGTQKRRLRVKPVDDDTYVVNTDYWTIDGWQVFGSCTLNRHD